MHLRHRVRRLGNLLNLSTAFGLAVARLGRARVGRGPDGLLLADGYRLPFPLARAFTVGDVLITSERWPGADARLVAHEARHAWQWFARGGLPFLPLYVLAMGWSVLRTGDRGARNVFERLAGLDDGGYPDVPPRPLFRRRLRRPR